MKIAEGVGPFEEAYLALEAEASSPYASFVYDDAAQSKRVQKLLFERASGDLAPRFAKLFYDEQRALGLVVAMTGEELQVTRLKAAVVLRKGNALTDGASRRLAKAARILLRPEASDFYLSRMAIAPECRRRGLGRELLSHFEGMGRELGLRRLVLEVSPAHREASAMYAKAGFLRVDGGGTVEDPETGRTLSYVHMMKSLTVAP